MRLFLFLITAIIVFDSGILSADTDEWNVISDKDGIVLSQKAVDLSAYRTYKADAVINMSMETLIEVMLDVNSYTEWMPGCTGAKTVSEKKIDDPVIKDYIIHILWDAQWPVKNRDFVIETRADVDWISGRASVVLDSIDNSRVPVSNKKFRLKKYWGKFDCQYISRNETRVSYQSMIHPGGKVGPGLSNTFTRNIPRGIMKGLRRIAANDKYKKAAIKDFY